MPTEAPKPDDMMADLKSAYAELTAPAEEAPDGTPEEAPSALTEAPAEEPATAEKPTTERARNEDGTFAPKPKEKEAPAAKAPEVTTKPKLAAVPKPGPEVKTEVAPAAPPPTATKAPSTWRPEVREKWASLPPEVQAEVARREREIALGFQQTEGHKREAEQWRQAVGPYEMMFRADGQTPHQAVGGLLQFAAALRTSPEPRKAQMIASLLRTYAITPESLAAAWKDEVPAGGGGAPAPQEFRDPRVDQLLAERERDAEAAHMAALEKVRASPEYGEFFDDLKEEAGLQLIAAAQAKRPMTIEQAFQRAAMLTPSVSGVLAQRKAAEDAKAKQAALAGKRAAASSIRSNPAPPDDGDGGESDGSLRSDLELVSRKLAAGRR